RRSQNNLKCAITVERRTGRCINVEPIDPLRRVNPGSLFTEILQRDLNTLVVHLLEVVSELLAAFGAAREEFCDVGDGRMPIKRFDQGRRPHVDEAVEIVVDDVIVQRADVYAARGFVADAEHLRAVACRWNVLIAPPAFLEPDATRCGTLAVKPDTLG